MQMIETDLIRMNKVIRHRLRNSASGLKASITFLSKELSDRLSPAEMEYFPLILNECDGITYITNRMQQLFDPIFPTAPQPVSNILESVVESIHGTFPTAHITLDGDVADLSASISEFGPIQTALSDLLTNAIEAAPQGMVTICATRGDEDLTLSVSDEGPGLSEPDTDPFLPFFTTRTRHLGLGLTIARKGIEHLGGTLTLESIDNGTRATIRLPKNPTTEAYGISAAL